MKLVTLDFALFEPLCGSTRWSEKVFHRLLETMVEINLEFLACSKKRIPKLYESGVVYRREPPGSEIFKIIPCVLRDGFGDCEDLATWRVAELRFQGEKNTQVMIKKWLVGEFIQFHILVRRENGQDEDPSRILGMGSDRQW